MNRPGGSPCPSVGDYLTGCTTCTNAQGIPTGCTACTKRQKVALVQQEPDLGSSQGELRSGSVTLIPLTGESWGRNKGHEQI